VGNDVAAEIVEVVRALQGCKATEVAVHLKNPPQDLAEVIDTLISSGELIEVTYILPNLEYRAKSFLLPKGTELGGEDELATLSRIRNAAKAYLDDLDMGREGNLDVLRISLGPDDPTICGMSEAEWAETCIRAEDAVVPND